MRNSPSNPLIGAYSQRGLQVAESLLWLRPTDYSVQAICGRCSALPSHWNLWFRWGANNETKSTPALHLSDLTVPRVEHQYLFDNVQLRRQYISRYVQHGTVASIQEAGPVLRYTRCHFRSPHIGPILHPFPGGPDVLLAIPNTQWYLWYGDSAGGDLDSPQQPGGPTRLTDAYVASTVIKHPHDIDSLAVGSGGEFDSPMTYQGWILALVHDHSRLVDPDNPDSATVVQFSPYALYHLKQPDPLFDEQQAVFLSFTSNTFEIVHNPLHLPQHTIRLSPKNI